IIRIFSGVAILSGRNLRERFFYPGKQMLQLSWILLLNARNSPARKNRKCSWKHYGFPFSNNEVSESWSAEAGKRVFNGRFPGESQVNAPICYLTVVPERIG